MNQNQSASPIRDTVGFALGFTRENWRFIVMAAAVGAAATTVISALPLLSISLLAPAMLLSSGAQAVVYAAFTIAALSGVAAARSGWQTHGWRVWAALAVIGFFLFIVMFVVSIPVAIVLVSGPLAPYLADLQNAGGDQVAVQAIMMRFAEENSGPMLLVMLFYGVVWMYLTSRLYLAVPATIEHQRILTFETWNWTKGAVLTIIGARLLLLFPALLLSGAVAQLLMLVLGDSTVMPLIAGAISTFISLALVSSLEAGLSTALYRALKPAATSAA